MGAVLSPPTYKFGEFELDGARFELRRGGRVQKLERIPLELLILLAEKNGDIATRQEIIERLWGKDVFVDTEHGINTAIRKIRAALRDDVERSRYVQTIAGKGYRLISPIVSEATGNGTRNINSDAAVSDQGRAATPVSELEAKPQPRTGPRIFAFVAFPLLALVLVLGWLFRPSYGPPRITGATQLTSDGLWKWNAIATDGVRVYFSEEVNGHTAVSSVSVKGGSTVPLNLPFKEATVLNISPDRSELLVAESRIIGEAPLWRVPILGGTPRRIGNIVGHDVSLSPDGKRLTFTRGADLYIADADGSNVRKLLPTNQTPEVWAWRPTWSPNGRRLHFDYYVMGNHRSAIWQTDVDGSPAHRIFPPSSEAPMYCNSEWTADGRYFIFTSWKDLESGLPWPASNLWAIREGNDIFHQPSATPVQLTTGPVHYFSHAISTDGRTIFAIGIMKHGELTRYSSKANKFFPYLGGISAEGVTFSRDGKWIAYVTYPQGELWRSKADGSEPLQLTFRPLFALDPSWSPDGKQIAFAGQRAGEKWQVYTVSVDGGAPEHIETPENAQDPSWSADGQSLVFGNDGFPGGEIHIFNFRTKTLSPLVGSHDLYSARWSPDGRYVAAVSLNDDRLMLFDFRTGKWDERAHMPDIAWPRWSKDGEYIYFSEIGDKQRVYRTSTTGHKIEEIMNLRDFRWTGAAPGWFSLTPDGDLLLLRNTSGGSEVYALPWDAP